MVVAGCELVVVVGVVMVVVVAGARSQRTSFCSGRQRLRSTPTTVTSSPA